MMRGDCMANDWEPRRGSRILRVLWIVGVVGAVDLICCCVASAFMMNNASRQQITVSGWTTTEATTGSIEASVSATGSIEPQAQAELRFPATGTVTEIL